MKREKFWRKVYMATIDYPFPETKADDALKAYDKRFTPTEQPRFPNDRKTIDFA